MAAKRIVIVTGGASGIGLGISRALAAQREPSTHVAIFDINSATGAPVVANLQQEFPHASFSFHQVDISLWKSISAAFAQVYSQHGRIDHVFANAGITEIGWLIDKEEQIPSEPELKTLNVNLVGTVYTIKLAIHYLLKNPAEPSRGGITCTASNAGIYPLHIAPLYSAAKHGVIGLVRSLSRPLEKEKIRINALAPAVVESNISSSKELFKHMIITPMSTVTKAAQNFVEDPGLTGKVAELHEGNITFRDPPPFVDENSEKNIEMFWKLGLVSKL
ncbi:hypothetical protein VTN31DRAFT_7013 [Thermomyces dupontii]|uniref:uncharacterized protein n=1 Tax=Talaromyces thermophilus TaxID=28565 RepID=UPI003743B838